MEFCLDIAKSVIESPRLYIFETFLIHSNIKSCQTGRKDVGDPPLPILKPVKHIKVL